MKLSTGLTLGKYAPLHKGHQFVIETALAEVDELVVMIYDCPDTTRIPLTTRARWLRALYPRVQVIEAYNGPTQVSEDPKIERLHEEYIIASLEGRKITHFYSSEFYGEHVSRALSAIDRRVDEQRRNYPIRATSIRADPYRYRNCVHPLVYRDLVTNVVLLGAPSTGKTTLARHLAQQYQTVWMPEYGREYWELHQVNRRLTPAQLIEIAEGHLSREDLLLEQANRYLFTDTNAISTYLFSQYYHCRAPAKLECLAQSALCRYDIILVCDTDIPYDDTWDRSGAAQREDFQRRLLGELTRRDVIFHTLRGSLRERAEHARRILNGYHKY